MTRVAHPRREIHTMDDVIDEAMANRFDAAAEVLERHGWYHGDLWPFAGQGRPWRAGVPVCAVGALIVAGDETRARCGTDLIVLCNAVKPETEILDRLLVARAQMRSEGRMRVARWNDHPLRTAAQVVELLRAAAKVARGAPL